jgi:hypothetical protein
MKIAAIGALCATWRRSYVEPRARHAMWRDAVAHMHRIVDARRNCAV